MFERLTDFCDSLLEMGLPGYDIVVYQKGECIYRHFNGYSDLENKIKMNGKERFNIYSCSKPITCVAAMQLYEKGMFSLEDKLSDYMPEFSEMYVQTDDGLRKANTPIRIKNLFEMTSGISYQKTPPVLKFIEDTDGRAPTLEFMKYLAKSPLKFDPGEKWLYGYSHDVLAALVELLSGEKFEEYVKKNIFDVLGMNNSTFLLSDDELDTISKQYRFKDGKAIEQPKKVLTYKLGSEYASGGAGGITTVDDYIKFLEALRTNVLLKKETLELMTTDRLTDKQREGYWTSKTHGYGLGMRCPNEARKYTDFGWGGAACSFLAVDPENELSVFFGTHLLDSPVQGIRSMLYRIVKAELIDPDEFEAVKAELKKMHNYNLTY
ncbi:MAG: beta-lactamase family protein [Clostridia bacterium]|nr:beta-lactamase family protein [Clostridia bacterium]